MKDGKSNGGSKDKSRPHAAKASPSKVQTSDPVDGGLHYGSNIDPNNLENDSDYERPYEYESEAFNSPISSDDEGRTAFDSYNEDTKYGKVEFKVGQMFPTMDVFKQALKDYFAYEGKDVIYIKNEKQRVRAACAGESCPWLILTFWNSANRCYQVKTLFNEHNCGRDFGSNLADRVWVTSKLVKRLLTQHAVAAMYKIGVNPEDFVHTWLTMDSIRATYAHTMKPVNSEEYWEPTDAPRPLPPPIKRPAHRPKVKRRIDPVETEINPNKAKKIFEVTCNKCGQKGHYYKTCTNPAMDPNWKPMTKKERRANGAKKKSNSVGVDVCKNTTNLQEGGHGNCNEATNVAGVGVNHKAPPPPTQFVQSSFMPTPPPAPRPTLWFKSQLPQGPWWTKL
ncbi:hypothetical protein Ahy_A02g007663 [Arachis hypogaea]|uniref:CCHC-type domain-containing protein n=1 Tax=Arachis hypogaea TaxID=3818 RepID=A0A445ED13_ARAHY|nr:hypothetical protein Ahy_A02g007663 [Arachis hypogaea]